VEQLNIEGKRSGEGFVAHKVKLVSALSRALADRVLLMDLTIGRRGFLGYLKALGGSNIVKIVPFRENLQGEPSNGSASGSQAHDRKGLKVICGSNTSYLAEGDWIGDKTPMTICEVRVSPRNTVKPNMGTSELAEALNRVLPFTAKDDNRPILQCVYFVVKDGKLHMVSADGFRLAMVRLDYDDGEGQAPVSGTGQALVNRDDLKGVANALRRAKRVRVSFEAGGESLDGMSLIIDTELIRYKWRTVNGTFPDYEKLTPTEFHYSAHFDTVEAIKAISSLKALANAKAYPLDLNIGNGKMVVANPDAKGQAELSADTEGEGKVRVDGRYLAEVLKACGGMVDLNVTTPVSPMLFSHDGYSVVVMPMMTEEARKAAAESKVEAKPTEKPAEKPKGKDKGKGKGKTKPEPVTEPEKEPVTA
jgi:DNA polymerase-3 subunit beta